MIGLFRCKKKYWVSPGLSSKSGNSIKEQILFLSSPLASKIVSKGTPLNIVLKGALQMFWLDKIRSLDLEELINHKDF